MQLAAGLEHSLQLFATNLLPENRVFCMNTRIERISGTVLAHGTSFAEPLGSSFNFLIFRRVFMSSTIQRFFAQSATALVLAVAATSAAWAHGDVTPQAVDTKSLPQLGDAWKTSNPYVGNADAIRIGSSA